MANGKEQSFVDPGWHFIQEPWGEAVIDDPEILEMLFEGGIYNADEDETLPLGAEVDSSAVSTQV